MFNVILDNISASNNLTIGDRNEIVLYRSGTIKLPSIYSVLSTFLVFEFSNRVRYFMPFVPMCLRVIVDMSSGSFDIFIFLISSWTCC